MNIQVFNTLSNKNNNSFYDNNLFKVAVLFFSSTVYSLSSFLISPHVSSPANDFMTTTEAVSTAPIYHQLENEKKM